MSSIARDCIQPHPSPARCPSQAADEGFSARDGWFRDPERTGDRDRGEITAGRASVTIHLGYPGFLGVSILSGATSPGALVGSVLDGGPAAAQADMVGGDVITAVGGVPVGSLLTSAPRWRPVRPGSASSSPGATVAAGRTRPASPWPSGRPTEPCLCRPCRRVRFDGTVAEPNPDAVLQFVDVSVRRGPKTLLDKINWVVEEDERWAVLGANGAGKTTLLQIAAALLHPSEGEAFVFGQRLGQVDVFELRPRIGLASAAIAQRIPNGERVLDVVVSAGYSVLGRWREAYGRLDLRRAAKLLDRVGVGALGERTYGTLSQGERQRVQIARALMTDPELLLLDEPAAGMDLGGREDLLRRLTRFNADPNSAASVLVTHHVEELPPGISHAMLLRDGSTVACGLARDVLTDAHLSATFGLSLRVERRRGRWYARAV